MWSGLLSSRLSRVQTPSTSLNLGRFSAQMVYKLRRKNIIEIGQREGFIVLVVTVSRIGIPKLISSYSYAIVASDKIISRIIVII